MKKGDRVFSIVCMGLSVWMILESFQYDYLSEFGPGPGFEPFWLGIVLAILSICLMVNSFRRPADEEYDKPRLPGWKSLGRVGLILLIIAGFTLAFETLGLILTVFLFVAIILYALEGISILKSIFYGIVFTGSVFVIFSYWMDISFPTGLLGI